MAALQAATSPGITTKSLTAFVRLPDTQINWQGPVGYGARLTWSHVVSLITEVRDLSPAISRPPAFSLIENWVDKADRLTGYY
jgi:hypothetical protein